MSSVPVTVTLATLDRPAGLARFLDGLLSGMSLPAELIIVDQSRDDATERMLGHYRTLPLALVYYRQPRRGLSASRNAAITRATQPVIAFSDDDCLPDPAWVQVIAQALSQPEGDCHYAAVSGRVLPLGPDRPGTYAVSLRTATRPATFHGKQIPWLAGTGGNLAVRAEWLRKIGPFDERLGAGTPGYAAEDAELLYRLLCAGADLRYEPAMLVYHERQDRPRRLSSRWGYAHGIGALCGLALHRGDAHALRLLGAWGGYQSLELLRWALRRTTSTFQERRLAIGGTLAGLAYGWKLDTRPPQWKE